MTLVNGLCISVLEDAYHFSLTSSPSADASPATIEASIPFAMAEPDAIRSLKSKFAAAGLSPHSQTIFCHPSTIRTAHLRTIMGIVARLGLPALNPKPIAFRQAYSAAFSAADFPAPSFALFIECTREESASDLIEFEPREDGRLLEIEGGGCSLFHAAAADLSAIAAHAYREAVAPNMTPTPARFAILGSPPALAKAVEGALATAHPSIPVYVVSPADLSQGAAKFALPDPNAPRTRVTATYIVPLPVSIECAGGGAVVAVPDDRKIRPADESVLLTTSVDNQTSVTVRISLGNHPRAADNLLSGTVVLEGLRPLPKGAAVILVRIVIRTSGATVTVEQVIDQELGPAPRKVVEFPDLIRHLGSDYSLFRVGEGRASAVFLEDSAVPVGELPV